jgi:hypothetical protein
MSLTNPTAGKNEPNAFYSGQQGLFLNDGHGNSGYPEAASQAPAVQEKEAQERVLASSILAAAAGIASVVGVVGPLGTVGACLVGINTAGSCLVGIAGLAAFPAIPVLLGAAVLLGGAVGAAKGYKEATNEIDMAQNSAKFIPEDVKQPLMADTSLTNISAGENEPNAFYSRERGLFLNDGHGNSGYPEAASQAPAVQEKEADQWILASTSLINPTAGKNEPNAFYSRQRGLFFDNGHGSSGYLDLTPEHPDGFRLR